MAGHRLCRIGSLVGVLAFAGGGSLAQAVDQSTLLHAIHLVENPTNSTRVGRRGELGPYQFRPTTWRMYTTKSFQLATNQEESDAVAERHYAWIKEGLEKAGLEATPYRVALVWNAGLTATVSGRITSETRQYARRVENVLSDIQREAERKKQDEAIRQQQWVAAQEAARKLEASLMASASSNSTVTSVDATEHSPIVFSLARNGAAAGGLSN